MGLTWIDRLLGRREERTISPGTLWRTDANFWGSTTDSGVAVNAESAFTLIAFWACVRLISSDISTLPVQVYRRTGDLRYPLPEPRWVHQPDAYDPSVTRTIHFSQVLTSLLTDGNAYTLVEPDVFDPEVLSVLPPATVNPKKSGRWTEYDIRDPRGNIKATVGPDQLLHVTSFRKPGALKGMNPITAAEEGIGLGIATQRWSARIFGQGTLPPGFIEVPGEASQDAIDQMAADLSKRTGGWRKAGLMGFLTSGAKYVGTGLSPKDADLSSIQEDIVEEMARLFGIPPHLIGSQKPGAVAYASVEQRSIDYVTHGLLHYLRPIEDAYSRMVPGDNRLMAAGSNTRFAFNVDGLLRGDVATRYSAYSTGLMNGVLQINEVRAKEDLPPVEGGDANRVQMQMVDINAPPPAPAPEVAPEPEEEPAAEEEAPQEAAGLNQALLAVLTQRELVPAPPMTVAPVIVNGNDGQTMVMEALDRAAAQTLTVMEGGMRTIEGRVDEYQSASRELIEQITAMRAELRAPRVTHKQVIRAADGRIIEVREVSTLAEEATG